MKREKLKRRCLSLFTALGTILFATLCFAEEAAAPPGGVPSFPSPGFSEPAKVEAPAATTAAPAAAAASEPKPDPGGIVTGDKSNVIDAGGNSFVVSEPTDKADPDYTKKRKEFEEFQAQASKEPLTLRLADSVGRVRIATNFTWTLATGYLVLFMQAGFALLTCGLVRKKNAAHLMMLNFAAYVFAFLAYYACLLYTSPSPRDGLLSRMPSSA